MKYGCKFSLKKKSQKCLYQCPYAPLLFLLPSHCWILHYNLQYLPSDWIFLPSDSLLFVSAVKSETLTYYLDLVTCEFYALFPVKTI